VAAYLKEKQLEAELFLTAMADKGASASRKA